MKVRLQRFMADCGVASRRECEAMIAAGRVRVNGQIRRDMPVMIEPGTDTVTVDEEKIGIDTGVDPGLKEQAKVYFLLNKPKGILVTTYDPANRKTVGELMTGVPERVFPVGRLDMDARGCLIMTNDGELANRLTHPRYGVEKTYIVEVDGRVGHNEIEKVKRGVWLGPDRGATLAPAVKSERFGIRLVGRERGRTILEVTVAEGKNREIRRVMARIGHVVRDMNRVAIAGKITLQNLKVGAFRPLTEKEVKWLYHASTSEFHGEKQAATQAWFEAKEMEKERKRLATEAETEKLKPRQPAASPAPRKEFRERPARKGKKPFVPPSGRNAGKPLGGNFIGRKLLEANERRNARELKTESTDNFIADDSAPAASSPPRASHPLGDAARSDE
jgi:pseudouridine synthase